MDEAMRKLLRAIERSEGTPLEKPLYRIGKAMRRLRAIRKYKDDGEPHGSLTRSEEIERPSKN